MKEREPSFEAKELQTLVIETHIESVQREGDYLEDTVDLMITYWNYSEGEAPFTTWREGQGNVETVRSIHLCFRGDDAAGRVIDALKGCIAFIESAREREHQTARKGIKEKEA